MPSFREAKRRSAVLQASVRQLFGCWLWVVWGVACQPSAESGFRSVSPTVSTSVSSAVSQIGAQNAGAETDLSPAARWQLMPESLVAGSFDEQSDGRKLFLLRGLRLVERPDGSISQADELLEGDTDEYVELPARLGGGYWFFSLSGSHTEIWHAADWTEKLTGVTLLDFSVDELIPGFRGVYATARSSTRVQWIPWGKLNGQNGAALPTAAAWDSLAFGNGGRAVVLAAVRGLLATSDFGTSWSSVPVTGTPIEVQLSAKGEPQIKTTAGLWEMSAGGDFFRTSASGVDTLFQSAASTQARLGGPQNLSVKAPGLAADGVVTRRGPLGPRPLRAALLHGISDSPGSALVVVGRRFGRVRLRDGAVLTSVPYQGVLPCRGLPLADGLGFVCGSKQSATEIYRVEDSHLRLEVRFPQSRVVRAIGNGSLEVDGPCVGSSIRIESHWSGAKSGTKLSSTCLLHFSRAPWQLSRRSRGAMERIVALADGRVVLIELPRERRAGRLSIWSRDGEPLPSQPLNLSGSNSSISLASTGIWSRQPREVKPGIVGAWVFGGQSFAGLTLELSGDTQVSAVADSLSDSMFHGAHVMQVIGAVTVRESHDYGASWSSNKLPPSVLTQVSSSRTAKVRGCSAIGCLYDDWGRIGWGEPSVLEKLSPPKLLRVPLSYSFWALTCHPAPGEVEQSGRSEPLKARRVMPPLTSLKDGSTRSSAAESSAPATSSWLPLMGSAGPVFAHGLRGYDFGQVDRAGGYRAYAWGPASNSWRREGRWVVAVQDRFGAQAPWRTATSHSPWRDAEHAAALFGLNFGVTADWNLDLAASGQSGVLRVREKNLESHFLLENNRAALLLPIDPKMSLGALQGVVKIGEQWFLASADAEHIRVYRVMSQGLQQLGQYPRVARFPVKLIGNKIGTRMAIWQKTARLGWFIYPLDITSGQVGEPLNIMRPQLGRTPPACAENQNGWSVTSSVPLTDPGLSESNIHMSFVGGAEPLRVHALAAKLIISEQGVCAESLAALGQDVPNEGQVFRKGRPSSTALPLTVTESLSERRWTFLCQP